MAKSVRTSLTLFVPARSKRKALWDRRDLSFPQRLKDTRCPAADWFLSQRQAPMESRGPMGQGKQKSFGDKGF